MKKIVILMISLLLPMLASLPIYAYDFEADGIYYNIGDNNTVTVTKGEVKYVGTVSIPERAKNGNTTYRVLSIGNEAFQNCSELTSITIPNSVLNIGELSFAHCKSLVSVTIPDNITNIGNYAFMYCTGLSSVTIGGSVTSIGIDAFWGCNNLSKITSNIKQPFIVSDKVFGSWEKDIYSIATLTVPKGTKSLYQNTAGWNKFQNIIEADSGDKSKYDSTTDYSKQYLTFVATESGRFEFHGNSESIQPIYYSLDSGNTWNVLTTDGYSTPTVQAGQKVMWKNVDIKAFGIGSFSSTARFTVEGNIMSLLSSDESFISATTIFSWAFYKLFQYCIGLTSAENLVLPATTLNRSCYQNMFAGCTSLTTAPKILPATTLAESCYWGMFAGCTSLTTAPTLPATTLAERCYVGMFNGCTSLTTPPSLPATTLAESCYASMFDNCTSLTTAPVLPAKTLVTECYYEMFSGCNNLNYVKCLATDLSASSCTADWLDCVSSSGTFVKATNMSSWTRGNSGIPNGWMVQDTEIDQVIEYGGIYYKIGENNTVSVTSGDTKYSGDVVIPSQVSYMNKIYDVTSIGDLAFGYCYSLTSVEIPNSVKSIGFGAFNTCRKLKSITIPSSVISIGYEGFCDCMELTSVHIMDLEAWCKINFSYEDSQPLKCAEHLYLDGVEVKDLVIPNSITSIGGWSFLGCKGLVSVTIPNSVVSIGNSAFAGCSGLTSIVSEIKNPFEISDDVFLSYDKDIYATVTLTVPKGTKSLYQSTAGWNKFQNIVEASGVGTEFEADGIRYKMCENNSVSVIQRSNRSSYGDVVIPSHVSYDGFNYIVTAIDDYAFCSCDIGGKMYYEDLIMTSITIPSTIKSIGVDAFADRMGLTAVYITDLDAWCNIQFHGEDSNPLYYAHHLFLNGIEIKDLVIPNSVTSISDGAFMGSSFTSITIPASVTRIGSYAFKECSGLNAVNITDLEAWFNISFESNPLYHAHHLFLNGTEITELIVPKSISRIGSKSFQGCSGLTSVTIPNNITGIEDYAFSYCNGLTSIILEIKNPFSIDESTFLSRESEKDIYTSATLVVPAGTKSLYQSTAGWNKFQNIVEAEADQSVFEENGITYLGTVNTQMAVVQSVSNGVKNVIIPESVYYNGKTYQVAGIDDQAFTSLDVNYISLPTTVTSITDKTFSRCNMGALVWSAEATLPGNTFSNASMGTDANFLLYVKSASYAPSTVKNVVVNGVASSVLLSDDGGKFYCPEQFKANSISYTHYYNMETGGGKGWETLALPFDVQKISHSTRGEIIPFAAYKNELSQKPFWLANFTVSGFKRTSAIQANEPYIIAMPNSSNYNNNYNLAGSVTFSSENIVVPKTPSFSGTFLPAFDTVSKSSSVMALNVNNRNVTYTGNFDAGSRFISNLRDVRPFEAYMVSTTRGVYVISVDDGTMGLEDILISADEVREVTIHTLSGQLVERTIRRDFDKIWNSLSKGVYIVNGKKLIK